MDMLTMHFIIFSHLLSDFFFHVLAMFAFLGCPRHISLQGSDPRRKTILILNHLPFSSVLRSNRPGRENPPRLRDELLDAEPVRLSGPESHMPCQRPAPPRPGRRIAAIAACGSAAAPSATPWRCPLRPDRSRFRSGLAIKRKRPTMPTFLPSASSQVRPS